MLELPEICNKDGVMSYVFISYSSQDRPYAEKLATSLTERGFDIWEETPLSPLRWRLWAGIAVILVLLLVGGYALLNGGNGKDNSTPTNPIGTTQVAVRDTPTDTPSDTPTHTPTPDPLVLAHQSVTRNADWTTIERTFDDSITMVLVPVGCFEMGSTDEQIDYAVSLGGQREWFSDEQPVETICIEEPFWIDKTEVTQLILRGWAAQIMAGVISMVQIAPKRV
jgi:hypothetical protein